MKSTKRLLCSLFAIIAVAFMIGSAFACVAGDINGADDQGVSDSNADSTFMVIGCKDKKEERGNFEAINEAVGKANEWVSEGYYDVTVYVQRDYEALDVRLSVSNGVDIVVNDGVTLTINSSESSSVVSLYENSVLYVHGTVDIMSGRLQVAEKSCISAIDGKVVVRESTKADIYISNTYPCAWIGGDQGQSYLMGAKVQLNTVGDSASGYQFGTVVKVLSDDVCHIDGFDVGEYDTLLLRGLDTTVFENNGLHVNEGKAGMGTVKVYTGQDESGKEIYKPWFGKDAIVGTARVYEDIDTPIFVSFERQMSVLKDAIVTLNMPRVVYDTEALDVEGTLILDKTIYVKERVYVTGMLVLEDRDFLCPYDADKPVEVDVSFKGIITLGYNNKWYGNGAALDPTIVSTVKLMLVKLADNAGVSYQFTISGIVNVNHVDEYSSFDLRGNKDLLSIEIAGFITVNGTVKISDMTKAMPLPIKTEGLSRIAFTAYSEVWITVDGETSKVVGRDGKIELSIGKLSEKELSYLREWVSDDEVFEKLSLTISTIMLVHTKTGKGITANIAGQVYFDGLEIGKDDNYQIVGNLFIGSYSKSKFTTEVHNKGTIAVIGMMFVREPFHSCEDGSKFSMVGPTHFVGERAEYHVGEEKLVGSKSDYLFTLKGKGGMTMINTLKSRLIVMAGDNTDNDYAVLNQRLTLDNSTFLLVGFSYVKIDKEKEFLGLSEDDLAALSKIHIVDVPGKLVVANGGVIDDTAGNRFLLVHGDTVFQYGGHYVSKGTHMVGMLNAETRPQFALADGALLIIRSNEISEEVLEMLIKEDPNTPYRNLLLGKSYIVNGPTGAGKVWINNPTIAYNERIVYNESDIYVLGGADPVISNFTVKGEAWTTTDWTNFEPLIGSSDKAMFQLTNLMSKVSVSYNPNDERDFATAFIVEGHVTLNGDLEIDGFTTLTLLTAEKHLFSTTLRVNGNIEVTESRYFIMSGDDNIVRFLEGSSLIYEGKNFIGKKGEAITTIHDGAYAEIKANGKGGMDIHTFGKVFVNRGQTLTIWENDTLTVTNSIDNESFTVSGTLEVFSKDSLRLQLGSIYIRQTAKLTIGGEDIFGDENATMSIGETAHVILAPYLNGGCFIKVIGDSEDQIGENDMVTLNEGKKLEIGSDKTFRGLALLNANFVISKKATFTSDSRYNLAAVTTKTPSETTGTSSIIGIGATQDSGDCPKISIVDHIDEKTETPVYFIDFNDSRTHGIHATDKIVISSSMVKDVEVDENSPIEEILKFFTVKRVDLYGGVYFSNQYTVKATDYFGIHDGNENKYVTIDASVIVNGTLYMETSSITVSSKGGNSLCTGADGIVYIKGSQETKVSWGGKMVGSDTDAPLLFGSDTLLSARVDSETGNSNVRFLSGSLILKQGQEKAHVIAEGSYVTFAKGEGAETGATFYVNSKLSIEGKLTVADGGTVNFNKKGYMDIVQGKGSLVLRENSSLIIDSAKWFGADGQLSVESRVVDGCVELTTDKDGLIMTVADWSGLTVNEGKTFVLPTDYRIVLGKWVTVHVESNAVVEINSEPTNITIDTGYHIEFEIGAKLMQRENGYVEVIGPDGKSFKTSGEDGILCLGVEDTVFGTKVAIRLDNGRTSAEGVTKGITVEVMKKNFSFTTKYPCYVQSECTLIINDAVDVKVESTKVEIYGTLIVTNEKFVCEPWMKFMSGSSFVFNGKQIIGTEGISIKSGFAHVSVGQESGKSKVSVDVSGSIDIAKGATVTIGEYATDKLLLLNMKGSQNIDVHGIFVVDVKYFKFNSNMFCFYDGSAFTYTDEDGKENELIGDNAAIKLTLPVSTEVEYFGYLSLKYNKETKGYDVRLNYDICATVKKNFLLHENDSFTVGALARLVIWNNVTMTVNCKTLKVNGALEFEGKNGNVALADGSTIELAYGSKLISNGVLIVGDLTDENAKVTMLNDQCGGERGGIIMSAIYEGGVQKGILSTVRSAISVNPGDFIFRSTDKAILMNDVEVRGTVHLDSLEQVSIGRGVKVSFLPIMSPESDVVLEFKAELYVDGEAYISSTDKTALFYVKPDMPSLEPPETYTKIIVRVSPEGVQTMEIDGCVVLTKEYTVSENKSLVVDKHSTFEVKGKLTVDGGKFVTFGTVLIDEDMFSYTNGCFVIEHPATVIYDGEMIVGDDRGAWISIHDSPRSHGYISFNNGDKTMVAGGRVVVNTAMTVPEGFRLILRDCEMDIYGSLTLEGDTWRNMIDMEFDSAIAFHVGTKLVDTVDGIERTVIGTDDDNALFSLSGVQSPTSKISISTNSDYGRKGVFILSGPVEYFSVTINVPYTVGRGYTLVVDTYSTLFVVDDLTLFGSLQVHGDLVFKGEAALQLGVGGVMHITHGATVSSDNEVIIGYPCDGTFHDATIELMGYSTTIDIFGMRSGVGMEMMGHVIINTFKTVILPVNWTLFVGGQLDVNGTLIVKNPNGMEIVEFYPNYPVATIELGPMSTFKATINGSINLGGFVSSEHVIGVRGNVNLSRDLVLDGTLGINGNLILNGHNIDGASKRVYAMGAVVLDGQNSHQLDDFMGSIRAHQYYDGPMKYVAMKKVIVTWTMDVSAVGKGIKQIYYTETNDFNGFGTLMIKLEDFYQIKSIKVIGGEIVQASEGVWYVYSSGFDVKVSIEVEEVGASSDYELNINEIVDATQHPGFRAMLSSNTAQYINAGTLEIHYTYKTLVDNKWVFFVSGFSAEKWTKEIKADDQKVTELEFDNVLRESANVAAGSYLVSAYATFTTVIGGETMYWSSPTILSMSDVPVPKEQTVADIFFASVMKAEAY